MSTHQHPATICIHAGNITENTSLSGISGVNTPIYTSSAYQYGKDKPNIYPRYFNTPNQKVIVEKLAQLEKTETGLVFSSGMAAVSTTLLGLLQAGDHVILQNGLYGGTYHFAESEFKRLGIEHTFLTDNQISTFQKAIQPNTKVVYIETPSNPLLQLTDLKKVAQLCQESRLISVIDNTFASPINQTPADFGIDVIVHSGTKYLGGHSDICFGAVLSTNTYIEKIYQRAINLGGSLDAQTCYLIERSLKTLALRVERQSENALKIAHFLSDLSYIKTVNYPGLPAHPDYEMACRQMHGFGAMLSFELAKNDSEKSQEFAESFSLIVPALSLGGIETTICVPARTSHIKMTPEQRQKVGVSDGLLRLSVGIEDVNDLILDLKNTLENFS